MDKLPYREFLAMLQEKTREADIPEIAVRHLGMGACMPQVPDPMAGIIQYLYTKINTLHKQVSIRIKEAEYIMQQDCRHTVKNVNPTQIAAKLFGCLDILHKHTISATGVQYFKYTYSRVNIRLFLE